MSRILVISSNEARRQSLLTIVGFLGEKCEAVGFEKAIGALEQFVGLDAVIIDADDEQLASDVIEKFPAFPFVVVGKGTRGITASFFLIFVQTYLQTLFLLKKLSIYNRLRSNLSNMLLSVT